VILEYAACSLPERDQKQQLILNGNDQYRKLRILFLRLKIENSTLLLHDIYRRFDFTNYFVKIAIILRAIILEK